MRIKIKTRTYWYFAIKREYQFLTRKHIVELVNYNYSVHITARPVRRKVQAMNAPRIEVKPINNGMEYPE